MGPIFGACLKFSVGSKFVMCLKFFVGQKSACTNFNFFFGLDSDFTTLCLPRMLTSTIPVNGSKAALLSNNILHNKYATTTKKILQYTILSKNLVGTNLFHT